MVRARLFVFLSDLVLLQFEVAHKVADAHTESIWSVCWTNKNKIVSGSVDETVKVW